MCRSSLKSSEAEKAVDPTAATASAASVARLFGAMEVVLDQERFLIEATRLPWFQRTREEVEIAAGAAQSKVGTLGTDLRSHLLIYQTMCTAFIRLYDAGRWGS